MCLFLNIIKQRKEMKQGGYVARMEQTRKLYGSWNT